MTIDIILAEGATDAVGPYTEFVEAERADTHASIRLPRGEREDGLTTVHVGLVELVRASPVLTYDELPTVGVVVTADNLSIIDYDKDWPRGDNPDHEPYGWMRDHEPFRLLHTGSFRDDLAKAAGA